MPVAIVVMLLAVVALIAAPDARRRAIAGYALAMAIGPVLAVWLISRGPASYWTYRYMLFSIVGWSVGAGLGIAYLAARVKGTRLARLPAPLSPRFTLAAVLVAVVGLVGIHDQLALRQNEAHNLWAYPEMPSNGQPVDYQAAAAVLEANQRPGDVIAYEVATRTTTRSTPASPITCGASPCRRRSSRRRRRSRRTACSRSSASTRRSASRERRGSGWSTSTTWTPTRSPRSRRPRRASCETLGYQIQTQYQENGITVALLSIGPVSS